MIDTKAIRQARWGMVADPSTILILCDEIEKLRQEISQLKERSATELFGWVKSSEVECSKRYGGSINLWREKYDCDIPIYIASQTQQQELEQPEAVQHQWWFKELESFWGSGDHVVTLDTRRAVKIACDHIQQPV